MDVQPLQREGALPLPFRGFPGNSEGDVSACSVGDLGSIPRSGRSPGEGNGNPLQYSCLENPMDGGVQGIAKSHTQLNIFTSAFLFYLGPKQIGRCPSALVRGAVYSVCQSN